MTVKHLLLLDHDGVLVDTESWYYESWSRAHEDVGLALDRGTDADPRGHQD